MMKRAFSAGLAAVAVLAALLSFPARAQTPVTGAPVQGVAQYRGTTNASVKITTGLTYQLVLAALPGTSTVRQSLTIENNNASDNCEILIGSIIGTTAIVSGTTTTSSNVTVGGVTLTALQASIVLAPNGSYTRYWPYVPSDAIFATCTNTGDSLYVDTQ